MYKIGILGAGTWGMALATTLSKNGNEVIVWSAVELEVRVYSLTRKHPHLPGMAIPEQIAFTSEIRNACEDREVILFAVPSVYIRNTARKAVQYINNNQIIINVAKGIENGTLFTMTQVIDEEFRKVDKCPQIVVLSGPTHAEEVALDMPTTIVSSSKNRKCAELVQEMFMNTCMRVYTNHDVLGVELCGAVKNIIAIAAGMAVGLGYGDNAKAALITRGLAETRRLGVAMGCLEETFSGLAGVGDLIVTATSKHSRNYKAGYLVGSSVKPSQAIEEVGMVVEGVNALPAVIQLSAKYYIEMPIVEAVNAVFNEGTDVKELEKRLMQREMKSEFLKTRLDLNYENKIDQNTRNMEMKRVITYGTFDLLHYGHINLLKRAKALGDYLIVVLSSDKFNWNEKHKKCYFTYEQRKALLESIRYVDLVIPETNWEQKKTDVHEFHIDTFVMGDDWVGKFDYLREEGVEVVYLPRTPEISTTQIKHDLNEIQK